MKQTFTSAFFASVLLASLLTAAAPARADYCGDGILDVGIEECDDGNFLNRDGCSSHCRIEDMTPPSVVSVSISEGGLGVSTLLKRIDIEFSESLDASSIPAAAIRLEQNAQPTSIHFELLPSRTTVRVYIENQLLGQTEYALRIKGVKDPAGNLMEREFIRVFKTETAVDLIAPSVYANPEGGAYSVAQSVSLAAYLNNRSKTDDNLDASAKIYYTLDGSAPTLKSTVFTSSFRVATDTTLKFMAQDAVGNKSRIYTEKYTFGCPELAHAKSATSYPACRIEACTYGFFLRNNVCIQNLNIDPNNPEVNAVTAPLFPSDTPTTIVSKPAVRITEEHKGVIPRPLIFHDTKRGTLIRFEKNTRITRSDGSLFSGLLLSPINLYQKSFPINFGYSFKSIFEFAASDGKPLFFSPAYRITFMMSDVFDPQGEVAVFTYDASTEQYHLYDPAKVRSNAASGEVTVTADRTETFFVAQPGKSYNRAEFTDTENHWAKNYIEALYRKGVVKGRDKGIFAPDQNLTRAEFIKIALAITETPIPSVDSLQKAPFKDVPLDAWYAPYIAQVKAMGLTRGYADGTFKPDKPINRAEAIQILISALKFDVSGHTGEVSKKSFKDVLIGQWYSPAVDFAIQNKMLDGIRDKKGAILSLFGPQYAITRGEMAKLAIKALETKEALAKVKK